MIELKKVLIWLLSSVWLSQMMGCHGQAMDTTNVRVAAEWEPHAATWMQWPRYYEAEMRPAFAEIIATVKVYETVNIVANSDDELEQAQIYLNKRGLSSTNIVWHTFATDNSWMRDNGPIYVTNGKNTWVQNWRFDAWGGNFGQEVTFSRDNMIPKKVAKHLQLELKDHQSYVLEKGNLEFNGKGVLVLNWDCQNQRNPGLSKEEHEAILKQAFGLNKIIWAYGYDPQDATTGHIDGIARFINATTLAITDTGWSTELDLAEAARQEGLNVVWYSGDPNWLVGNGFVVAAADSDGEVNQLLKEQLQQFFPQRDVHLINVDSIAESGGGIHCVTNDQPLIGFEK